MTSQLFVHFLPTFEPFTLQGSLAVVIDVLRASTTIVHALAAGAEAVIPCLERDDALQLRQQFQSDSTLLGGERGGQLIPGFDLDNSPYSYPPETVRGKTILFTTTNGTRALKQCREADRVLVGTFNNRDALLGILRLRAGRIDLVCAGTDGEPTMEDVFFAGEIAHHLHHDRPDLDCSDDQTQIAMSFFERHGDSPERLHQILCQSRGGRNLIELGFERDIERAAERNRFSLIPELSREPWRITESSPPPEGLPHLSPAPPGL